MTGATGLTALKFMECEIDQIITPTANGLKRQMRGSAKRHDQPAHYPRMKTTNTLVLRRQDRAVDNERGSGTLRASRGNCGEDYLKMTPPLKWETARLGLDNAALGDGALAHRRQCCPGPVCQMKNIPLVISDPFKKTLHLGVEKEEEVMPIPMRPIANLMGHRRKQTPIPLAIR